MYNNTASYMSPNALDSHIWTQWEKPFHDIFKKKKGKKNFVFLNYHETSTIVSSLKVWVPSPGKPIYAGRKYGQRFENYSFSFKKLKDATEF